MDAHILHLGDVERICCIGAGKVGILSMAVLSHHWPNKVFAVVDKNRDIINNINGFNEEQKKVMPFSEPGMEKLLNAPNLIFSSNIDLELDLCRVIFIAVDIPLKAQPKQVKNYLDVQNLEDVTKAILDSIGRASILQTKYVAVKSSLPIDYKRETFNRFSGYDHFNYLRIVTNPEFFSDGSVVEDLSHSRKIVLGEFHQNGQQKFRDLYLPVVENDHGRCRICMLVSRKL